MTLIRAFEIETERQYKLARIGGYCHLSIGQEATTVGAVAAMDESDLLVTGYRSHGFQEWLGHRDLGTTQIYADYAPSSREAEMVAAAFARGNVRGSNLSESHRA